MYVVVACSCRRKAQSLYLSRLLRHWLQLLTQPRRSLNSTTTGNVQLFLKCECVCDAFVKLHVVHEAKTCSEWSEQQVEIVCCMQSIRGKCISIFGDLTSKFCWEIVWFCVIVTLMTMSATWILMRGRGGKEEELLHLSENVSAHCHCMCGETSFSYASLNVIGSLKLEHILRVNNRKLC